MALRAGTLGKDPTAKNGYAKSMAQAIENAFKKEWGYAMSGMALPAPSPEMQLLFAAVAQGVVRYLQKNANAFEIKVPVPGGPPVKAKVTITTKGVLHK